MSVDFVNAYIERLVKEVQEAIKTRLLLETQIVILERTNTDLLAQIDTYKKAEEKAAKKTKTKEVDTSTF